MNKPIHSSAYYAMIGRRGGQAGTGKSKRRPTTTLSIAAKLGWARRKEKGIE